ncbi:ATP-binding protein [Cellulophaga baltica]|nr:MULTISPECIES: ATP-binding protein [Cellulophaga]MBU2997328.1 ATP-binding protein [Cellulophaga baltica]MDO6768726.1 ATP-binding protein [Cellulophaga sp. 1_MG-2023]
MRAKKIVIAGGPSTGKTSVVSGIENAGHTCYHEISREITLQAREEGIEQLFLSDPLLFSERILAGRLKQYNQANDVKKSIVFFDRALPDVVAYLDCFGTKYSKEFDTICQENKYDIIFLLPPWKEIHTSDNERYENFEEALKIHDFLKKTYKKFGYKIIEVPKDTIENRVTFILNNVI